jgi:2'-5' RNA ligase
MPCICLIFDEKSNKKLEDAYKKINKKFKEDLLSVKKDLKPHITLMYFSKEKGEKYFSEIKKVIANTAHKFNSYKVKINGFGIFIRQDKYILYFTTPYDTVLQQIHANIWDQFNVKHPDDDHYNPKKFTPHISIPIYHSNQKNTFKIMKELTKMKFDFELVGSDIAYLTGNLLNPQVYIQYHFLLFLFFFLILVVQVFFNVKYFILYLKYLYFAPSS